MRPPFLLSLAVLTAFPSVLYGQGDEVDFLAFPLGARAIGMGRAYAATAGGLEGVAYNPAGLGDFSGRGFTFTHAEGFLDTNVNQFALGLDVGLPGAVALAFTIQDLGDVPVTEDSPTGTGQSLVAKNFILAGSYGVAPTGGFRLGGTVKVFQERLEVEGAGTLPGGDRVGTSVAFDFGAIFLASRFPLQFGLALQNLGSDFAPGGSQREDELPQRLRLGLAYGLGLSPTTGHQVDLILAVDVESEFPDLDRTNGFAGVELGWDARYFTRGGIILEDETNSSGWTLGFGIHHRGYELEIAKQVELTDFGDFFDDTHLTFNLRF